MNIHLYMENNIFLLEGKMESKIKKDVNDILKEIDGEKVLNNLAKGTVKFIKNGGKVKKINIKLNNLSEDTRREPSNKTKPIVNVNINPVLRRAASGSKGIWQIFSEIFISGAGETFDAFMGVMDWAFKETIEIKKELKNIYGGNPNTGFGMLDSYLVRLLKGIY